MSGYTTLGIGFSTLGVIALFAVCIQNFLLHGKITVLAALLTKPTDEFVPAESPALNWETSDVIAWRKFLLTETGMRFVAKCRQNISTEMLAACNDPMHTTHSAAKSAGADSLLRWQFNLASDQILSRVSGVQGSNDTTDGQQNEAVSVERRSF